MDALTLLRTVVRVTDDLLYANIQQHPLYAEHASLSCTQLITALQECRHPKLLQVSLLVSLLVHSRLLPASTADAALPDDLYECLSDEMELWVLLERRKAEAAHARASQMQVHMHTYHEQILL